MVDGWKYYNHAMIPTTAPHEIPDLTPIKSGSIWDGLREGMPLLARWTSDFDCGYETGWWYCIKDTPFDISKLNSKKRYEINKGKKNFDVRVIDPAKYKNALFEIQVAAYSAYPKKYRPVVKKESFKSDIDKWNDCLIFGGFVKGTENLIGYALLTEHESYVDFNNLRVRPECEKQAINAAMVAEILKYYESRLSNSFYICDGSRNVNHETAFQDYLEKYFVFRKAFCKLYVSFNKKIKWMIELSFPFRRILCRFDGIKAFHQLNSLLKMEEIVRRQRKKLQG